MRKKVALNVDNRYKTLIENAFYYSNPPSNQNIVRETRPPKHEYIRKLLYKDLNKVSTEKVGFPISGVSLFSFQILADPLALMSILSL